MKLTQLVTVGLTVVGLSTITTQAQIVVSTAEVDTAANGGLATDSTTFISAESSNSFGSNVALATAGSTLSSSGFVSYDSSNPSFLTDGDQFDNTYSPVAPYPSNSNPNGLGYVANGYGTGTTVSTASTPWTLTISLDTSVNTLGYTINNIKVISGWDYSFVDQNFTVAYSTDNTNFTPLGEGYSLGHTAEGGIITLQTSLTQTGGDPLATNVKALQFVFSPSTTYNTLAGYREIEAFGVPTTAVVPEPTTFALMFGGLALFAYRLRRRTI